MKLLERIELPGILPNQSTYEKLILIKSIKAKVEITPEEIEKFNLFTIPGTNNVSWNTLGTESDVEFDFTEGEKNIIVESLKAASNTERLPITLMDMYAALAV